MGAGVIPRPLAQVAAMAGGTLLGSRPAGPLPGDAASAQVTAVVTDSRRAGPGSLFVAIAGERTDGHAYLDAVARAHAEAALVSDVQAARAALGGAELPLVVVPDTVAALGRLAREHLADLRRRARERGGELTVVAVTGSVGKTTTKDLTRQILASVAPTVAPVASFNNEIGLPLTVLSSDASTRYLVLEMGASAPGHIAYLTGIAPLDAAAVLVVGHAHMDGFGGIEGVAAAKAEILSGLRPGGTAVLNLDDPRSAAMRPLAPAAVLTFSASGRAGADVRATDTVLEAGAYPLTTVHLPGAGPTRLRLSLPGAHNVANALAAAALALVAGVAPRDVLAALADARIESAHRMDVRPLAGDLLLVDDSYNANIDSMTASLATLPVLAAGRRRVVVVSEMLELGASSPADHRRTGELVAQAGAALLLTVGQGAAPAAAAARERGVEVVEVADAGAALARIDSLVRDGDAVLVKGSHGSGAWRLADHLKEVRSQ